MFIMQNNRDISTNNHNTEEMALLQDRPDLDIEAGTYLSPENNHPDEIIKKLEKGKRNYIRIIGETSMAIERLQKEQRCRIACWTIAGVAIGGLVACTTITAEKQSSDSALRTPAHVTISLVQGANAIGIIVSSILGGIAGRFLGQKCNPQIRL